MTVILSCSALKKAHSHSVLFDSLSFSVHKGDKIGIVGPNGSGKSTLMKILAKEEKPDDGSVVVRQSVQVGYVPQVSDYPADTIEKILLDILKQNSGRSEDDHILKASIVLSKLGFNQPDQLASTLSGGWKKRFDIAKAIVLDPDLLLLDEPTNHLDFETIAWLENFLQKGNWSFIVISHDRVFLEKVTNHILELNRAFPKGMFFVEGNYSTFLERREEFLTSLAQYEQGLRSKVRNEVAWLRQSPAARTTKQQARINQAMELQEELQTLKAAKPKPKEEWQFDSAGMQSRKMIAAKNLSKTLNGRTLFKNVDVTLSAGSRLGIAGDNGSGKTTLLRILSGELQPDQGTVKYAEGIKIVYFDQHREKLPENHSLKDCLAPNGDTVEYRGKPMHVNGWARRFHFGMDRMLLPVSELSGGERARILLARLMLQPADVLLLDEPTNDLDIETLEVLEESIAEFPGAVVLITHDRRMLDNVCNEIIGLGIEGNYSFADVYQWEKAKQAVKQVETKIQEKESSQKSSKSNKPKLSYKEQQELDKLPKLIEEKEALIAKLEAEVNAGTSTKLEELCKKLAELHHELEAAFLRWAELEEKK